MSVPAPINSNAFPGNRNPLPSPADHVPYSGPSDQQATLNYSDGPKTVVIKIGSVGFSLPTSPFLASPRASHPSVPASFSEPITPRDLWLTEELWRVGFRKMEGWKAAKFAMREFSTLRNSDFCFPCSPQLLLLLLLLSSRLFLCVSCSVLRCEQASLSTSDGRFLHQSKICSLVEEICRLRKAGHAVILVTSGAVSVGCLRLKLDHRPESGPAKQAIAAIGQSRLMRVYDDFFSHLGQPIAQVLLSRESFGQRRHYTNAYNCFQELLKMGVVPLVNENDTVSLRTGDNDTLAALVATLVDANWLFLLTDVDGVYTANPFRDPTATRISQVAKIDDLDVNLEGSGQWGTGGMYTKISAARISTSAGVTTVVCHSEDPRVISKIMDGESIGTTFLPSKSPIKGKKKWIAHGTVPGGVVMLGELAFLFCFLSFLLSGRSLSSSFSLSLPLCVGCCSIPRRRRSTARGGGEEISLRCRDHRRGGTLQ